MSMRRIFSPVKDSITARFLNHTSSQPFILTESELDFWRAMGSKLHIVDRRYPVTVWNKFYPVSVTLIKNMTEEAKHFSQSSYLYTVMHSYNFVLILDLFAEVYTFAGTI